MSDSDNTPFGFGRFVPGFDFLQNLAKGASSGVSAMPGLTSWVAPTVSVEELEKRIGELKSVQFWLEQNTRALAATVQGAAGGTTGLTAEQIQEKLGLGATPKAVRCSVSFR